MRNKRVWQYLSKYMPFFDYYFTILEWYSVKKDKKFQRMWRVELIGQFKIMNHYLEKQNGDVAPELLSLRFRASTFNCRKVKVITESNLWFLAILTGSSISTSITYILFLTEMQKRANPVKWIYPYWKTISQPIEALSKWRIHCKNQKCDNKKAEPSDPAFN